MNVPELLQQLSVDAIIELFEIDTTTIGGTDYFYFHAGTNAARAPIVWQTKTYSAWPIEAEGFEKSVRGTLPRPVIRIANVLSTMFPILTTFDDLIGAKVIRRRTFARYLDGQPTADPTQYLPDDVFYVERKKSANAVLVELELASALDLEGMKLPARLITVNVCQAVYRNANDGCPYVGTAYFNASDQVVATLALDVCSKAVSGCKARFGAQAVLPFLGFPAARTYRV